jgi:hypothetical protein
MFIHIGEKKIVSDLSIIGIFNYDSFIKSQINNKYLDKIENEQCDIRTIVIDTNNHVFFSKVSPYTVIKRDNFDENDYIWRKG